MLVDVGLDCGRADILEHIFSCLSVRELRYSLLPVLDDKERGAYEAAVKQRARKSRTALGEVRPTAYMAH